MSPDVVYDAGISGTGGFLHVVYTVHTYGSEEDRDVYYMRGEPDGDDVDWFNDEGVINDTVGWDVVRARPRIDAGVDTTGFDSGNGYDWNGSQNDEEIPYVGVVWEASYYNDSDEIWLTDVVFCRLPFDDARVYGEDIIAYGSSNFILEPHQNLHQVFPFIDIEPRENVSGASSLIVWTHAKEVLENSVWTYDSSNADAQVKGTNTWRLANLNSQFWPQILIDDGDMPNSDLNGLATCAAKKDESGNEQEGFLVWLNGTVDVDQPEVYAVDIDWSETSMYNITHGTPEVISDGYSGIGSGEDYNFFPEIAIQDEVIGKAVWTDLANSRYWADVMGDFSDW